MEDPSKPSLTLADATERVNQRLPAGERVSKEWLRRKITSGHLFAERAGGTSTAPYMLHEGDVARLAEREAHKRRTRGTVVGYGDFSEKVKASEATPETKAAILAVHDKHELFDRVEREMYEGPDAPALRRKFEGLDAEARFEAEARELAERVRRAERLRKRALELLEAEDEDED